MSHSPTVTIDKPRRKDFCCICFFNYPELKRDGNKYHEWCYRMHISSHNPPPESLVKMNRSKE